MPNTTKMMWPFPAIDQDPWYESFSSMVSAMDASGYAAREDRQLLLGGGGIVEFTSSSGLLSWGANFEIFSTVSGFVFTIPAGSVTLVDGEVAYAVVTRAPTQNLTLSMIVANTVPNTDGALIFGVRRGSSVYWRNGSKSDDGIPGNIFAGGAGGTDADAVHVNAGGEINGVVTNKATPVAADVILIEDSEDSFNKKSITLTNLLSGGGGGNTLDEAYDQGGAGVGRTITADTDAVTINGGSDVNEVLTLTKPGGSGDIVSVTHSGTGDGLILSTNTGKAITIGSRSGFVYPSQINIGVPFASDPGITIRDTTNSVEVELYAGNVLGDDTATLGTNTNHPIRIYTNDLVQWSFEQAGSFESTLNALSLRASILDFAHEPGADDNENYLVGGNGSSAAVSASDTGRLIYDESTNKWRYSEDGSSYADCFGAGAGLPATLGVQFAALIEDPANTPKFAVLTQDMIQPAFAVTLNLDGTNTFEVGNDIVNPTFTVSYSPPSAIIAAATIDDGAGPSPGVALISPYTAGTITETYSSLAGAAANGETQVFDVSADSTLGITKGDTDTATWLPRVFWDALEDAAYTEAFIEGMANSALASSRNRTFTLDTGTGSPDLYMFYAFPTAYGTGTPAFFDDDSGFAAGFSKVAPSVSVTNGFGNTQTYEIWRSNNPNLEVRTIVVS